MKKHATPLYRSPKSSSPSYSAVELCISSSPVGATAPGPSTAETRDGDGQWETCRPGVQATRMAELPGHHLSVPANVGNIETAAERPVLFIHVNPDSYGHPRSQNMQ